MVSKFRIHKYILIWKYIFILMIMRLIWKSIFIIMIMGANQWASKFKIHKIYTNIKILFYFYSHGDQ